MNEQRQADIKVVYVPTDKLKPSEYNPRKANQKECDDLKKSIQRFGIVDPIIVNNAPGRKDIIIGGHFRHRMCAELGINTVPVVYVNIPDIEKEKELNVRLNKNSGSFDFDLLANFSEEFLVDVGFDTHELDVIFKGIDDPNEDNVPPIPKSELICKKCGINFYNSNKTRIYCSRKCYFESVVDNYSRKCSNCGGEFTGVKKQKYCSVKCWSEHNRTKIKCLRCGKIFNVENYELKRRKVKYCSFRCYKGEGGKTIIKCEYCKKNIERYKSHIHSDIIFCNNKCKGEWQSINLIGSRNPKWRGGWKKYYGGNWDEQKNKARLRDNCICQICKTKENGKAHDVHHKIPFRIYGLKRYKEANDLSNLITLCNCCHSKIESRQRYSDFVKAKV